MVELCLKHFDRDISVFCAKIKPYWKSDRTSTFSINMHLHSCLNLLLLSDSISDWEREDEGKSERTRENVNVCARIIIVFNFVMTRWMALNWILHELLLDEKLSSVTQEYISLGCLVGNCYVHHSFILDILIGCFAIFFFFFRFPFLVFLARNQQQITIQLCAIKLHRSHNYTISYSRLMGATISILFFPICIFPEPRIIILYWIDFNKKNNYFVLH